MALCACRHTAWYCVHVATPGYQLCCTCRKNREVTVVHREQAILCVLFADHKISEENTRDEPVDL